jgi:broad-specificity NMP kinase
MILGITGTPGTGKTEVAKRVAKALGWMYVSLNDLAEEEDLYKGYDSERMCKIVDIEALRREVEILGLSHKNLVIDAHYAHEMPCDLVIVLRTDPKILRKRMIKKGFWKGKIEENIEAELMDVIKEEALKRHKNVYEIDTSHISPEIAAKKVINIVENESLITKDLRIPEELKSEFRKPYGDVLEGGWKQITEKLKSEISEKKPLLIYVGDSTSYNLINHGLIPDMIIIDGKEKRKKFRKEIRFVYPKVNVRNPSGVVTLELWKVVEKLMPDVQIGKKCIIFVKGEEDLAVLPCIFFAPTGSFIIYGLFNKLVKIEVSEKVRKKVRKLVEKIKNYQ